MILTIESTITDVLRGSLGQAVNSVEVTSLEPGSVVVGMDVHTDSSGGYIKDVLQKAVEDDRLASLGADTRSEITSQGRW